MSGYGPLASLAGIGGTAAASLFSDDIGKYFGKQFNSPMAGKIASVALPMLLSGGLGAAVGGKYGWGNAVPAGIMSLMGLMGKDEESGKSTGGVSVMNTPTGQYARYQTTEPTYNPEKPESILKQSLSEAATGVSGAPGAETAQPAATAAKQATKESPGIMGSLGDLMNDPVGKIIVSMVLSNMFSGALGSASGAEQDYNQKRNQARDAYNKQMGDINYIRSWYQ